MKWLPLCSLETGVQTCSVATVRMVSQRWRLCAVTIAAGGTVSLLAHGILSIQRGIPHLTNTPTHTHTHQTPQIFMKCATNVLLDACLIICTNNSRELDVL